MRRTHKKLGASSRKAGGCSTSSSPTSQRTFLQRVATTIAAYDMIPRHTTVLVAFSGGPDSTALLHALWSLRERFRCRVRACHVHHGLRGGEADADAEHAAAFARRLRVPFALRRADVAGFAAAEKLSVEEAARQIRYQLLGEMADEANADRVATGHTADDQAETVLLNLIRGTGPDGLSGIPPVRGNIIRPLLEVGRAQVEAYCRGNHLPYRTDASNQDLSFTRNRIRHQVIPLLKGIQPSVVGALSRLAEIARGENEFIGKLVEAMADRIAFGGAEGLRIGILEIMAFPVGLQRRLLREALARVKGDLRDVDMERLDAIVELVRSGRTGAVIELPRGVRVEREADCLLIPGPAPLSPMPEGRWRLDVPGEAAMEELDLVLTAKRSRSVRVVDEPNTAVLDEDALEAPLLVRMWLPGDRFLPLGMSRSKKLQDFFVDQHVPARQRRRIPLVLSGDDIVWVVGHRISDRHKVTQRTRRTIRITARPLA